MSKSMQTLVIFAEVPENLYYFEADDDWIKFQGIFVNAVAKTKKEQKLQNELSERMFDKETGATKISMHTFDKPVVIADPTIIIHCGFIL